MLIFLTSLFATLNNAVLDLPFPCCPGLENLALRHHSGVLRRSARKRPKLTSGDRLLWICLSRLWRDWLSAMAIVKPVAPEAGRSEEHTSELQSHHDLVCRLLLEKKNKKTKKES